MSYSFDAELEASLAFVPKFDFANIAAARQTARELAEQAPGVDESGVEIRDVMIDVSEPAGQMRARVFTPHHGTRPMPVIYDLHPGGFCAGSVENVHGRAVELAREVEAVIVSVDYRLAPEHPYPIPATDSYQGLCWVYDNAGELGVDHGRLAIHGQSGGGGLAAAVALMARDREGPSICFQYLGVPELDDRMQTQSMRQFVDTPSWNRPLAELSWSHYLGDALRPGADGVPSYAAPARETRYAGLPPTYIAVMQFDPHRDEGIAYAQKLLEAGVRVELHVFPGTFHGSNGVRAAEVSKRELAEEVAVLRRALHPSA